MPGPGAEVILELQRTRGNAFVQRLVFSRLASSGRVNNCDREADLVSSATEQSNVVKSSARAGSQIGEPGLREHAATGFCKRTFDKQSL